MHADINLYLDSFINEDMFLWLVN